MYLYTQSAAAAAAAALYRCSRCSSCCCSPSCAGWQKLLLTHWIWLHPKFSFFFLETRYILNIYIYIPLGSAVAFTASVCLYYVLGSYRHVRSQGGHQWFAIFFASFAWSRVVSQPSTSPGGPDILGIILLQEVIYTWHATHTNRILLPLLLML